MAEKVYPTYDIESKLVAEGYEYVVGVDESGRGPLFGSVVAAAVYIPPKGIEHLQDKVHDSKQLSEKRRNEMISLICQHASVGIGSASNIEIDEMNILEATKLAMKRAVNHLVIEPSYLIVDGNMKIEGFPCPYQSVVKGDAISLSIAAASIVAKVTRDNEIQNLDPFYDLYGIKKNKGYGTAEHREALKLYGATDLHRKSFRPVAECL